MGVEQHIMPHNSRTFKQGVTNIGWSSQARVQKGLTQINQTLLETLNYRVARVEQKKAEELLRINNLATIGELSAGLTHEIITPLTNIKINLSIIKEKQYLAREIQTALLGVEQISNLVNNYLKQVRLTDCTECFDPVSEIKLAETLLEYKVRKNNITLIHDFPNGIRLYGDPTKFTQVMINLISNAIDAYSEYCEHSEQPNDFRIVEISGKLEEGQEGQSNLRIRILDMASGIPEKLKTKIFDMFFTTKKDKGTGLGLPICRQIVENHFNGSLELISTKNPTIFEIKLPIKRCNKQGKQPSESKANRSRNSRAETCRSQNSRTKTYKTKTSSSRGKPNKKT